MSSFSQAPADQNAEPTSSPAASPNCRLASVTPDAAGTVRCPACYAIVPPDHIGYKLHCRRCGYLESCCNPI